MFQEISKLTLGAVNKNEYKFIKFISSNSPKPQEILK